MSAMQLISRLTPTWIKRKIVSYVLDRVPKQEPKENVNVKRIAQDIADREVAAKLAVNHSEKFAGKVVAVVGGCGYIGYCICEKLALYGATVCVCSRNEEKVTQTTQKLIAMGGHAIPVVMNVHNEESIRTGFELIREKAGKLDALINCAGGSARENANQIAEQQASVIQNVIDTNLVGTILTCKWAAKQMIEQRHGKIINLSSTIGVGGKSGYSEYAAAKAGVIGFSKSLALELGKDGIAVNCVTPGIVERGDITGSSIDWMTKKNAMKSVGIANDIAYGVEYFLSDEANFITGQNLIIDGGRSLGLMGD